MDILKPLLRLLGLPGSQSRKTAKEPEPIHLSSAQLEQIENRIAEFIDERKEWILNRLRELARLFAIEVCGYSVLSNLMLMDWAGRELRADKRGAFTINDGLDTKRET